jgi:hypothetical protein
MTRGGGGSVALTTAAVMIAVSAATKNTPGPPLTKQAEDSTVKRTMKTRVTIKIES